MFVLEESRLLEDTINDSEISKLYLSLKTNESSNREQPLIQILAHEKVALLCELLLQFHRSNTESKLTREQKDELFHRLQLEKNDVAALVLITAATLTQLFVIQNFTGPSTVESSCHDGLPETFHQLSKQFDFSSLTIEGSEVYHLVVNPWTLKTVQLLWSNLSSLGCSRRLLELEFLVWKHRFLSIHLMLLHEPSETILKELKKLQEYIFDHHILNDMKENKTELVRFNVVELCCELIQSALLRDAITSCRKIFDYVSQITGVSVEHTGVLGKRTRFQHKNVPQLLVRVTKEATNKNPSEPLVAKTTALPKDIELDDDTLLPDIAFIAKDDNGESTCTEQELTVEAQLLMLTKLDYILRTEVMEESLKDEWTLAYVRSIIKSATVWPIAFKALIIRSIVEKKHMRKMDRALRQLEDLIKTLEKPDDEENYRMQSFYSVLPYSKWQTQRSLGDISFDLCLYKNALEVYTRIEYWEGIMKCYSFLGETSKAEKVIRQELAKQETPYLYCLLGDAKDDIEFYEKAWSLSNCRFARAKKSIGTYYYVRKQFEQAVEHYELALSASPSNTSILSLLAYSCLLLERYERAAECYRNITYNDDTNFLAWNNLSKAYIKIGQKERAWRTLQEAIKCNYEEWKVWENFMIVSMDIGALDDVITAWHRLLDIKSSHKDDQVMSALTYSLIKRSYGSDEPQFKKLYEDALKLVARISTTGACSSRVWICYFKMLVREFEIFEDQARGAAEPSKLDLDSRVSKIVNSLQRSTPATIGLGAWYQEPATVDKVLDSYDEILDNYTLAFEILGSRKELLMQWKNFKLSSNTILKTLREKGYKTK